MFGMSLICLINTNTCHVFTFPSTSVCVALAKISLNLITQCNFKPIKNKLYSFKLKTTVTNKPFGTGDVLKLTHQLQYQYIATYHKHTICPEENARTQFAQNRNIAVYTCTRFLTKARF